MPQIGPYTLTNAVALAPMAGVTDLPFRQLCARLGAGLVVSEMVNSNPRLRNTDKTRLRTRHDAEIEPRSVQIAGNDPQQMAAAARYNVALGAQVIDINMGCPAKKVCRKAAGSALLADEPLVRDILRAVVAAVQVPVTLKIRTGPSPQARNGVSIARIAEDAGIAALAVHGRTRACAFRGSAEYDTIADIVAAVDIPVFANGDIESGSAARSPQGWPTAAHRPHLRWRSRSRCCMATSAPCTASTATSWGRASRASMSVGSCNTSHSGSCSGASSTPSTTAPPNST